MLLKLRRTMQNRLSTVGELWVSDLWICATLEDAWHMVKLPGITRIPAGTYPLKLRTAGELHPRYAARFPDMHKGMLWILDVPGFEFIYFHIGNDPEDSKGCILVGSEVIPPQSDNEPYKLIGSEKAYRELYPMVSLAIDHGETCWLQIIDPKR